MSEHTPMTRHIATFEPIGVDAGANQMLRTLLRHKGIFCAVFFAILFIGLGILFALPPTYTATAVVEISPQNANPFAGGGEPYAGAPSDDDLPMTVASVMQSRDVAEAVLNQLPAPPAKPGESALFCRLGLSMLCPQEHSVDPALAREAEIDRLIQAISVLPEPRSHIIDVSVTAPTAPRAAALANTVVQAYQQVVLAQQTAQAQQVANTLDRRAADLRQRWLTATLAADTYGAGHQLTDMDGPGGPLIDQQIAAVSANLVSAEARLAGAEAQADTLHQGADLPAQPMMVAAASTLMQLETSRAQLATEFGPNYPKIQALDQQIAVAKAAVAGEAGDAAASVREDRATSERQVQELTTQLNQLRAQAAAQATADGEYLNLKAEAASAQSAYQGFLKQADNVTDQNLFLGPPVSMISSAGIPLRATFPNKPKLGLGVLFVALVCGVSAALLRDFLADGFAEAQHLRAHVQLPLLATFPVVRPQPGCSIVNYVLDEPFSRTSEAVRRIAATLALLAAGGECGRTVLISSAGAHEGKSTLAVWLAMTVNQAGQKVLLIDGDHRRGSLMRQRTTEPGLGFSDLISGNARENEVIQTDPKTRIDFIPAGTKGARSFGTHDINRLRAVLADLKTTYSLIVIDSPPLAALVDGLVLASVADQTVFICRWQHTSRQAVVTSLEKLQTYGARVAGIVVSMAEGTAALTFDGDYSRRERQLIHQLYG